MDAYLKIVKNILENGVRKPNRTGIDTIALAGAFFEHDMSEGFPILTTKKVPLRLPASELEFFIKGLTDKKWLQDRNNHIWDEWCSPKKVPYGHDEETKKKMAEERELGPIYGFQWRHFNAEYTNFDANYEGKGIDQLKNVVETLKKNPTDRRMIISSWNPCQSGEMALPPCYIASQITVIGDKLNLLWNQRSVDVMIGLPFDIVSHALLLHLLAKETGLKEGRLVGFLGDAHIYENHLEGAKEQLTRTTKKLPRIETENFTSIFNWQHTDSKLLDYDSHGPIKFDIAV